MTIQGPGHGASRCGLVFDPLLRGCNRTRGHDGPCGESPDGLEEERGLGAPAADSWDVRPLWDDDPNNDGTTTEEEFYGMDPTKDKGDIDG